MSKTYIHYGHKHFDKSLFSSIKNMHSLTKPIGGLWASDVDAVRGWKDWCDDNEFREYEKDNSFKFTLVDANILTINSSNDLENLPKVENKYGMFSWVILDFEKISQEYDAIEVNISSDGMLYYSLYGWDCDSILVMNPDVVQEFQR